MDNVKFIDARKKLGQNSMKEFVNCNSDDAIVTMYIEPQELIFEKTIKNMKQFFEDEEIEKVIDNDDCIISFVSDSAVLQIIGLDYRWWIAVVRKTKRARLKRLFDFDDKIIEEKQNKKVKQVESYTCFCGTVIDGKIDNIASFDGQKKDLINFVNKEYQIRMIKSFFKAKVVYCLNSDENDIGNWKSYEDLLKEGVFVQ